MAFNAFNVKPFFSICAAFYLYPQTKDTLICCDSLLFRVSADDFYFFFSLVDSEA